MATADSYIAPAYNARLKAVFRKAERGEYIRIAGIGGSITGGATATTEANRWLNRSANWFSDRFGVSGQERLINAGIGSTESPYAALRCYDQVLKYNPDLVFVDFSVNNAPGDVDSYESLIRQLLAHSPAIAIIPVQFCNAIGEGQGNIGLEAVCVKYGLGSVSYQRDILAYLAGGGASTTYSDDTVHPNDAGHAKAATDVWYWLDQVRAMPTIAEPALNTITPPADNSFQDVAFVERAPLPTFFNSGFTYDPGTIEYGATVAGSFAEWRINVGEGGKIWVAYRTSNNTANGTIAAFVNDVPQSTTPTYDAAWPFDKIEVAQVATGVAAGEHRLRLITGAGATGANVDVFGIGYTI